MAERSTQTLHDQIRAMSPPDQLRLAASLMEAQQGDTAYAIANRVITELGAAIALAKLKKVTP